MEEERRFAAKAQEAILKAKEKEKRAAEKAPCKLNVGPGQLEAAGSGNKVILKTKGRKKQSN